MNFPMRAEILMQLKRDLLRNPLFHRWAGYIDISDQLFQLSSQVHVFH
jgi:hypothetical protein